MGSDYLLLHSLIGSFYCGKVGGSLDWGPATEEWGYLHLLWGKGVAHNTNTVLYGKIISQYTHGDVPPDCLPSSEWLYLWRASTRATDHTITLCLLSNDGLSLSELLMRALFVLGRPNNLSNLYSVSASVHVPNLCVNWSERMANGTSFSSRFLKSKTL